MHCINGDVPVLVLGMRLGMNCTRGLFRCRVWHWGLRFGLPSSFFVRARGGAGCVVVKTRPAPDAQLLGLWRTGSGMADCAGDACRPHSRPRQGSSKASELPAVHSALTRMVHET